MDMNERHRRTARRRDATALAIATLLTACGAQGPAGSSEPPATVKVTGGEIAGTTSSYDPAVRVYKGIPFAAPPIGDLRWRPPQPVAVWQGTRDASRFAPGCMQQQRSADSFYGPGATEMTEDCLYLNVWTTAAPDDRHPVLVWFHGGGLSAGTGAEPRFDGTALARRGVVVVTTNYRLGPFGFLAHALLSGEDERGSSGNYGLLDQIAALRWVQENVAAFGGDPQRVTIFGQSAGGTSVRPLTASPLARGPVQRALSQSGSAR